MCSRFLWIRVGPPRPPDKSCPGTRCRSRVGFCAEYCGCSTKIRWNLKNPDADFTYGMVSCSCAGRQFGDAPRRSGTSLPLQPGGRPQGRLPGLAQRLTRSPEWTEECRGAPAALGRAGRSSSSSPPSSSPSSSSSSGGGVSWPAGPGQKAEDHAEDADLPAKRATNYYPC